MTIDSNITKNIQEMSDATEQLTTNKVAQDSVEQQQNMDMFTETEQPPVFTGESVEVAGLGRKELLDITKKKAKEIVKEKLGKKGQKIERDIEVTEPTKVIEEAPEITKPQQIENEVQVLNKDKPSKIKPQEEKPSQQYYEVTDESIDEVAKKRERIIEEGTERVKPSQTVDVDQGVEVNRISTLPYDETSQAATVKASSQAFLKDNPKARTVKDVFAEAARRGIDVKLLEKVASGKGINLEAKLGSKTAQDLPEKIAGYIKLHDDNAAVLDDLFEKLAKGNATTTDRYNLKQHLIWHQEILKGMSNVQTDVAVSLNLFKRASVDMKGMKNVSAEMIENLNQQSLNDKTLREFADLWNTMPTIGGKNKLVLAQDDFNKSLMDTMYLTYKTNLLSSPDTIVENLIGATVTGVKTQIDDWAGALWGSARRKLLKQPITREDLIIDDIINGYAGLAHTSREALEAAVVTLRTGKRSYKKDIELSESFLQKLSDKDIKVPYTSIVLGKSPKADQEYWKSIIKGVSYFPNLVLKTFGAGDEFAGSFFARMKLHSEASRYSRNRMADLISAGKSTDDAFKITSSEVEAFLKTQPANIYKNVEQAREFINLRYRFADEVKDVDIFGMKADGLASGVGKTYNWVNDKLSNTPFIRWMFPFSNSLTRIFEMTAASIPGLAVIAPTYWEDKAAGGARKDRAYGRMALGSVMLMGFKQLADQGILNGAGPTDPKHASTLRSRGHLPYSIRLGKSEYTDKDINSLRKILNEDEISVAQNGDLYISFERLDNFAMIAGMSSDYVDYTRYERDRFNSNELKKLALANMSVVYQFLGNQIWFEQTGRFLSAMQRANDRNKGNIVANYITQSLTFAGQNAMLGIPVASMFYNSLARKFATSWDEEKKTYNANVMNIDTTNDTEVMLHDIVVGMRQNSPLFRGNLVDQYDNLGRAVYEDEAYVDSWMKHIPGIRMSKERGEKVDRLMEIYHAGVSKPDQNWDGVELSAYQYEMFKKLYGNDVKLPAVNARTGKSKMLNLRGSIVNEIDNLVYRHDAKVVSEIKSEDIQKIIDLEVSKYRKVATQKMVGLSDAVEVSPGIKLQRYNNFYIDPVTKQKGGILFPELRNSINALKNFKRDQ